MNQPENTNPIGDDTETHVALRGGIGALRRLAMVMVALTCAVAVVAGTAGPAAAISSIRPPSFVGCAVTPNGNRVLQISPPRVWASYRTEQVVWVNQVERWDSSRKVWYKYSQYQNWASFNTFGMSVTSWSSFSTSQGGAYGNNVLSLRVYHPGYYRVASAIAGNQGGATWSRYLNGGNYCAMR